MYLPLITWHDIGLKQSNLLIILISTFNRSKLISNLKFEKGPTKARCYPHLWAFQAFINYEDNIGEYK